MKTTHATQKTSSKQIIKSCHVCGHVHASYEEVQRCEGCEKSFLPLNYFSKVHAKNSAEFETLFLGAEEIHEDDLIKGLYVLW